jgi:hypothetical protein
MKHTILASALLAGLGLAASALPSVALPMNASGLTTPANADLVQVRMHRRHRMRQGSASRGNAGMPSRSRFGGQHYGGTTGGPRR